MAKARSAMPERSSRAAAPPTGSRSAASVMERPSSRRLRGGAAHRRLVIEEGPVGAQPQGEAGADQDEHERADEGHAPAPGHVDDPAEDDGREDAGEAEAEIHEAARGAGILRRDVHRHRPDRRDDEFREEEGAGEAKGGGGEVVDEEERQGEGEAAEEAEHDDVAPGAADAPPSPQHQIAREAANRVADEPGEEHARREVGRALEVEPVGMDEEGRDPVDVDPENPAIAEID